MLPAETQVEENLKFSPLALEILKDRYLWKNEDGVTVETPVELLQRVARCVANVEKTPALIKWYSESFFRIMADLDFLPNSPTLMNAGREAPHGQLAACFVVGVEDSMESICSALRKQMLIHKTGGGTGFNFSALRPKNTTVRSTNGRASGPVSFMRLFDLSTDVVQQGGMRRGANMAILDAYHADIEEFIACKDEDGVISNFNLSVGVTDDFMTQAVTAPGSQEGELLYKIAEHAWRSGDPGIVFFDALNRNNPLPSLGRITATNPCGESPLLDGEACNLGSINLSNFVRDDRTVDYDRLADVVWFAVRFLDNVIDAGQYPLPEIESAVKRTRKIGLGVMGFADMLYKLHVPYDSPAALVLAEDIMSLIEQEAINASEMNGQEKGIPPVLWHEGIERRNAAVTCIAPTGTLALLADCSSGIEPIFSLAHKRTITTVDGGKHTVDIFNPVYETLLNDASLTSSDLASICITAYEVHPLEQVRMQSVFQRHTDLAVSKTVNMRKNCTVEDVYDVYVEAWLRGCKGVTVYRDGSKGQQVLTVSDEGEMPEPKCTTC